MLSRQQQHQGPGFTRQGSKGGSTRAGNFFIELYAEGRKKAGYSFTMPRHRRKERNSQSRQLVGSCLFFKACSVSHIEQAAAAFFLGDQQHQGQGRKDNYFKACTAGTPPPPPSKGPIGGANAGQGKFLYTQQPKRAKGGNRKTGKATRKKAVAFLPSWEISSSTRARGPGRAARQQLSSW